jgi:hypothetical protein
LIKLVRSLNKLPGLYLSPGFAIQEVDIKDLHKRVEDYEKFLDMHCRKVLKLNFIPWNVENSN